MTLKKNIVALSIMVSTCGLLLCLGGITSRAADAPKADKARKLVVVKAVWGILPDGPSFDVTQDVASMVEDNSLSVDANNGNFGDPAPGNAGKKLKVDYILHGVAGSQTVNERGTICVGVTQASMLTSDSTTWRRVPNAVAGPVSGVTLGEHGLFRPAMDKHTAYLLADANVDDMVWRFRQMAGVKNPPGQQRGWEKMFPAHAAQFLFGAGNTLRWVENADLRRRMDAVIAALKACRTADGLLPAPAANGEEGYSFMLLAHGLVAAAEAGNRDANDLLSAWAKWYRQRVANSTAGNPRSILYAGQNYFAATALMLANFAPGGTPEDVLAAYKHVHPEWMRLLAHRNLKAIWRMPGGHPHSAYCYGWMGFLDIYRATGDRRLLDAMLGGWELYRGHWQHPGGTLAICEEDIYPPDTLHITPITHTGENCSMVWWAKFNHKLHQLFPADERYVAEIEKVIYNVGLANQMGKSIAYHTHLEGRKESPDIDHTCCEVVGSYLYATLPEYIYSIADDGLYLNLYEPSSITWKTAGQTLRLTMRSQFPFQREVALRFSAEKPVTMKLRVRTPAWAAKEMPIKVNGKRVASGKPGSYVALDRTWTGGDRVEFTLPMDLVATPYKGADQVPQHKRYGILYGPVLMAAVGPLGEAVPRPDFGGKKNHTYLVRIAHDPAKLQEWLKPK
ncbi:MAG: beta-L-arabinofuranosidase domain-containing protein, partial [Thermoguttaceae bacterium]